LQQVDNKGSSEIEPSLGIKCARILLNAEQSRTVNTLQTEAAENQWMEEVADKTR
jgi:hypothetical protein